MKMTEAALEFAQATGSNPAKDVAALVWRGFSNDWFLDVCLDGADPDRIDGAYEYYYAIAEAANHERALRADPH